jgi:uncharacterized cupin superfamily protein
MGVLNTDLGKQLEAHALGARLWRLEPGQASVRQVFNDTDEEQLWLVAGAPPEFSSTLEMSEETLRRIYPGGPKALPPELSGE